MSATSPPILPPHIEETIRAIARLHKEHERSASPMQRTVEELTAAFGRPLFVTLLTLAVAGWIAVNLLAPATGHKALDPAPFNWLQGVLALLAVYMTAFILITQRRADELAAVREQLTLELAILGEQKTAKVIELLEEMRRDNPLLRDRFDEEAALMAKPSDPEAVLEAIKETHDLTLAEDEDVPPEAP